MSPAYQIMKQKVKTISNLSPVHVKEYMNSSPANAKELMNSTISDNMQKHFIEDPFVNYTSKRNQVVGQN